MSKIFLFIFTLAILLASCGKGDSTNDELKLLSRKWDLQDKNQKGLFIKLSNTNDQKKFSALFVKSDTIFGSWEYKDKKLTLIPTTIDPYAAHIDSVVTETDTSGSRLVFYSKGKKYLFSHFKNFEIRNLLNLLQ